MIKIPSDRLAEGTTFVAADGVAAQQLEISLAKQYHASGRTVWTEPAVRSYRAWTNRLWLEDLREDGRQLLSPGQARALWRRTIEQSTVSGRLIGSRNIVHWAMAAAQRLRDWGIDARELRPADGDLDFASFLGWAAAYDRALDDAGWLDPGAAEVALLERRANLQNDPPRRTIWADFDPTPAQARLWNRLNRSGWSLETWQPEPGNVSCRRVELQETGEELRTAGRWAAGMLAERGDSRVAIVVPDLESRRDEVGRLLDEVLQPEQACLGGESGPAFFDLGGEPADRAPLIGSALTALELVSARGRFAALSRWLRSPFFGVGPADMALRARLEAELRITVDAQLSVREGFRRAGLAGRVRAVSPGLADTLAGALRLIENEPARATPTHWVEVWRRILRQLGWRGEGSGSQSLIAWEAGLNDVTLLTPVVGEIPLGEALRELQAILSQPQRTGPSPLSGVFVLARLEDVGAGYDGIWVTGLTDSRWPQPARPNPILPLPLQRAHDMPLASPGAALEHSRRTLQRLIERAPEVVLSWPSVLHEYPTQPSPQILKFPEATQQALVGERDPCMGRALFRARRRQSVADVVPPLPDQRIRGGARTLELQATCPLRAFLEGRLGSRPLEPVRRGLSARHRGIAGHRAMQLLLLQKPSRRELLAWEPSERRDRIHASVQQALLEAFGPARHPLKVLFDLEAERLNAILSEFVAMDLGRPDFQVSTVEERVTLQIGDLELACRIDRIDLLVDAAQSHGRAIIDYKTGRAGTPQDWLKDRPRDVQLPLYTLMSGEAVGAAVIALLRSDGVQYKGLWSQQGAFPGRPTALPDERTWAMQLDVWRKQLEALALEYAAGDSRLFGSELSPASGAFAPLTRVYEQTALARGWLDRWSTE